jgi:hypothetical protein
MNFEYSVIIGLAFSYWLLFHLGMLTEHILNERRKRKELNG